LEDIISEYNKLVEEISKCTKCPLHRSRRNPVPGEGSINAEIMFVGEAPGEREDATGRPFVGAAGKFLDQLLASVGLRREEVYITNIVKCRPPGNRDPREEEVNACTPYLWRQIALIKPKVIIALGRHAAKVLYSKAGLKWSNMTRMHGKVVEATIDGHNVLLAVTYHPAAALYNPRLRDTIEEDFKNIFREVRKDAGKEEKTTRSLLDFFKKTS